MNADKLSTFLRWKTSTKNHTCDLFIEDADLNQLTPIVRKTEQEASALIRDCISWGYERETIAIDSGLDIWEYRAPILNEDLLRSRLYPDR